MLTNIIGNVYLPMLNKLSLLSSLICLQHISVFCFVVGDCLLQQQEGSQHHPTTILKGCHLHPSLSTLVSADHYMWIDISTMGKSTETILHVI